MNSFGSRRDALDALDLLVQEFEQLPMEERLFQLPKIMEFLRKQPLLAELATQQDRAHEMFVQSTTSDALSLFHLVVENFRPIHELLKEKETEEAKALAQTLTTYFAEPPAEDDEAPWLPNTAPRGKLQQLIQELHGVLRPMRAGKHGDALRDEAEKMAKVLMGGALRTDVQHRNAVLEQQSNASAAHRRLTALATAIIPSALSEDNLLRQMFGIHDVADVVFGTSHLDASTSHLEALAPPGVAISQGVPDRLNKLKMLESQARKDLQRVAKNLRIASSQTESLQALVRRFCARATLFDSERLRLGATTNTKKAEMFLTLEFARYLHDAGLQPLVDPKIGNLRPDIFDPRQSATLYVEAKQYSKKLSLTQVEKFAAQVWSTWLQLRSNWPVDEAYLLIFRRGGQPLSLPPTVRSGTLTLHIAYVDIAPATASGSRATESPLLVDQKILLPKGAATGQP